MLIICKHLHSKIFIENLQYTRHQARTKDYREEDMDPVPKAQVETQAIMAYYRY